MTIGMELSKQLVIGEVIARWAKITPDLEALVYKDKRFTFKELDERVNRLANGLTALGIQKGDKVGLILKNGNEIAECAFALAKLGAVYVPSNFRMTAREHVYQLGLAEVKGVIFADEFKSVIKEALAELPGVQFTICAGGTSLSEDIDYEKLLESSSPEPPMVYVDDDDPAAIIYTSGTTGDPKGVVLTHKNLMVMTLNYLVYAPDIEMTGITENPNALILLPNFHISGYGQLIIYMTPGQTVVFTNDAEPESIMAIIEKEKINGVSLVPAMWNWIVNHPRFKEYDLSSLLMGATGGAVMPMELKKQLTENLPNMTLMEAFGMAETCSLGTLATHEDLMTKHGSVGRPEFFIEVRVVDDNDQDVPIGEMGEIVYRGPTVLKEYYRDPETTAEAFRGGWFHSGDLVRQDEDGYFYVVGRKKDIIISGGENISAVEVEETLSTHPKILETAVVGVPDPKWGEAVKAFVILKEGETLSEEQVIAHCKETMASYKKPRYVEFMTDFPRTAGGKVQKFALAAREK
jgi:acyl-CoA synthetase (AMP-forming)/AMP-acid ligase II